MENIFKVERIDEAGVQSYRLSGPFTQSGVKNRNGRIYPYNESKREVIKLKEQVDSGTPVYLYKGHPPHSNMIKEDSCAVFEEITFIDDGQNITGWCKVRTLPDTVDGKKVNESLSRGDMWGISTRGTGNVVNGIVENYNMITADLVEFPSCQICNMRLTEELTNDLSDFLIEEKDLQEGGFNYSLDDKKQFEKVYKGLSDKFKEGKDFEVTSGKEGWYKQIKLKTSSQGGNTEAIKLASKLMNEDKLDEECGCFYSTLDEVEQKIGQRYLIDAIKDLWK